MLPSGFVLAAALMTMAPAQPAAPGVVKVYYTVPPSNPIAVSTTSPNLAPPAHAGLPASYGASDTPASFPIYSQPCTRGCADARGGTTWGDKFSKLWNFLTFQSLCKTPHSKGCARYTPPVTAFFPTCVGGTSHAACSGSSCERCPSCLRSGLSFFGQPTGLGGCVGCPSR